MPRTIALIVADSLVFKGKGSIREHPAMTALMIAPM
jgi:hypothetical protein